jgi:hypothetical protein
MISLVKERVNLSLLELALLLPLEPVFFLGILGFFLKIHRLEQHFRR